MANNQISKNGSGRGGRGGQSDAPIQLDLHGSVEERRGTDDHQSKTEAKPNEETNSPVKATWSFGQSADRLRSKLRGRWWIVAVIVVLSLSALGGTLKYLEQDAQRLVAERNRQGYLHNAKDEGLLSKANPFLTASTPAPTPQLSKEYIYAGSRMLAVEDANASATPTQTPTPPADLAVWRPSSGSWYVMGPNSTVAASASWGANGDTPEAGDYDGDGKTDFAVYRPSNNYWYVIKSSDSSGASYIFQSFGIAGDVPAPADYDGDHKTDLAVFRPSNHSWYVLKSSDNLIAAYDFGSSSGDTPVPADYDGDGKADVAVFRQSNSTFYVLKSSDGQLLAGQPSTTVTNGTPVTGDYDGDGKADFAIRSGANWIIQTNNTGGAIQTVNWQQASDTAVQNDYDGDGKTDIAVWRNANGGWYIRQSSRVGQSDELRTASWGASGDTPVPAFWRR